MGKKRFVIELGMGVDLHGQDSTKAAQRAVRNAVANNCLYGLSEIFDIKNPDEEMFIDVLIACPHPDKVATEAVLHELPFGKKKIEVVDGGMSSPGLYVPQLGDESPDILVAIASLTVSVHVDD